MSQLTPANASVSSNGPSNGSADGQPPTLPELSAETRQQIQAGAPAVGPGARSSQNPASQNAISQNVISQNPASRGPLTRTPNAQVPHPGRTATTPGAGRPGAMQRPDGATGRSSRSPADDPGTAAPAETPEPVYVRPETPEERDARMRRELADTVCDQYGVQREACRAQTERR